MEKKYHYLLEKLDRDIHKNNQYKIAKNIDDFARWKRWGFDHKLFSDHYDFARFLLDTPLGSQMKLFADRGIIKMIDDEPAIQIDGEWTKFSDFRNRFKVDSYNGEKVLVRSDDSPKSGLVYTFLDNGKGFQDHHPYLTDRSVAVAHLTDDEFQRTMETAQKFYDDAEYSKDFPHIVQIVSSEIDGMNTNFSNLILKPKHPWIRIILGKDMNGFKKGDVFDGGFGWTKKANLPGVASTGRFRLMDLWNYQPAKRRVVTNVPISDETLLELKAEILKHQRESIQLGRQLGFNLFRHNCTSFINRVGGIIPDLNMQTRIELKDLLHKVSPSWLQSIGTFATTSYRKAHDFGDRVTGALPAFIRIPARAIDRFVRRIFDFLFALPINLFTYVTGGMLGEKRRGFEEPVGPQKVRTSLKDFYYYVPGILQEWQKQQKSTVIFENPKTFAVAS